QMSEKNKKSFNIKNKKAYINGLLLVIFTTMLFFITIQKVETKRIDVRIGDEAPLEIRAIKEIEDKNATETLKRKVAASVESRYRISTSVQLTMKANIREFFNKVRELQEDETLTFSKKAEILGEESRILLSKNEYYIALK